MNYSPSTLAPFRVKYAKNRLSKFQHYAGDPDATRDSEEVLLESAERTRSFHNGGWLSFQPSAYSSTVSLRRRDRSMSNFVATEFVPGYLSLRRQPAVKNLEHLEHMKHDKKKFCSDLPKSLPVEAAWGQLESPSCHLLFFHQDRFLKALPIRAVRVEFFRTPTCL